MSSASTDPGPTIASPQPGIDVDELGNLGERFEGGLEDGHLLAGPPDEQHNRPLPHARAFRDEPEPATSKNRLTSST